MQATGSTARHSKANQPIERSYRLIVAVVEGLIEAVHAAAGDPPTDLKVPGIQANLTHHTFEFGDTFEAILLGGSFNKCPISSYKISR